MKPESVEAWEEVVAAVMAAILAYETSLSFERVDAALIKAGVSGNGRSELNARYKLLTTKADTKSQAEWLRVFYTHYLDYAKGELEKTRAETTER